MVETPKVFRDREHPLRKKSPDREYSRMESPERIVPFEYIELEVKFAQAVARRWNKPLKEVLLTHTQLHSNLGQLIPHGRASDNPVWQRYLTEIVDTVTPEKLAEETYKFYTQPHERIPQPWKENPRFGCFSFEYHPSESDTDAGVIEVHFGNSDKDGTSPLSDEKRQLRTEDLRLLFQYIKDNSEKYPHAKKIVRGSSWLYNTESYKRLFPASYINSASVRKRGTFMGGGAWGQFLDYKGAIKKSEAEKLLSNVETVENIDELYKAFPLKTINVEAPIEDFYKHLGISEN